MKIMTDKIVIGTNAKDNWLLIDPYANEKFTWVHLKSFPSPHVMIVDENPSKELIVMTAQVCKENSKYKNLKHVKVSTPKCYFMRNLAK